MPIVQHLCPQRHKHKGDLLTGSEIDASTVRLADLEIKAAGRSNKLLARVEDANGDGLQDLVVQIEDSDGVFAPGESVPTVTGSLLPEFESTQFQGTDTVCIVPAQVSRIAFASNRDGDLDIYIMNSDGSDQTRLTNHSANDSNPAWSPGGAKIAFDSFRDGDREIYVMTSTGGDLTNLTNNSALDETPQWSPDGSKIAFRSDRDSDAEIYVMTSTGGNPTNLTNNSGQDSDPAWSPDGSKIAFVAENGHNGNSEIYVMTSTGGNPTRLTNSPGDDGNPEWSPDGSKIVFFTSRDGGESPYEIYLMDAADTDDDGNGDNLTRLTNNFAFDTGPSWSPDGTKIAFKSDRDGNEEIYVMTPTGMLRQ